MKKIKRILGQILIVLIVTSNCSTFVYANETKKYIALGDSIAYGYGLSDISKQSYVSQVANELKIVASNKSVVGMNTSEFLDLINKEEIENEIKSANIITISIGSNDLLGIVVKLIGSAFKVDVNNEDNMLENVKVAFENATVTEKIQMIKSLYTSLNSEETKQELSLAVEKYDENWKKIMTKIKQLNPNATVIVTQFYNPYYGVNFQLINDEVNFSEYVDGYIQKFNTSLENNKELGYKIAYIYEDFNKIGVTNVNISLDEFNVDPHPNSVGHTIISDKVLKAYNEVNNIETEKIDINTCAISSVPDQIYTGKDIEPQIIVKDGEKELKEDEDYTISYNNNKEIGIANITIAGMGNYTGVKNIEFKIINNETKGNHINNENIQKDIAIGDSTVDNKNIPYAGSIEVLFILIIIITSIGIISKHKSDKIDIYRNKNCQKL